MERLVAHRTLVLLALVGVIWSVAAAVHPHADVIGIAIVWWTLVAIVVAHGRRVIHLKAWQITIVAMAAGGLVCGGVVTLFTGGSLLGTVIATLAALIVIEGLRHRIQLETRDDPPGTKEF